MDYKVKFQEFSGEPKEWKNWAKRHRVLLRSLQCETALDAEEGQEIYVGRGTFDRADLDPVKVRQVETAWRSLIDNCRDMAFDIVEAEESPSTAWKMLTDKYQPNTVGEVRKSRGR